MQQSFKPRKRRFVAEINVVPYIDVMLVLLIIFMVTAPLIMQGVEVELPQAPSEPMESDDNEPVIVSVDAQGQLFIDLGGDTETPRPLNEIQSVVNKVLNESPETPVLVWGDQNVPYGQVVAVMTALQAAGAPSVGLVTEPP